MLLLEAAVPEIVSWGAGGVAALSAVAVITTVRMFLSDRKEERAEKALHDKEAQERLFKHEKELQARYEESKAEDKAWRDNFNDTLVAAVERNTGAFNTQSITNEAKRAQSHDQTSALQAVVGDVKLMRAEFGLMANEFQRVVDALEGAGIELKKKDEDGAA